jgi:outer membrane protein OmpA-like peptidoglycan-associated protein
LVRYTEHAPVQGEGSLLLGYKNIVWVGAGYRSGSGVMAMAGVGIKNMVTIGYAFDYHLNSTVAKPLGGSHEVVVGIRIPYGNKNGKNPEADYAAKMKQIEGTQAIQTQKIDSLANAHVAQNEEIAKLNADIVAYKAKIAELDGKVQSVNNLIEAMQAKAKSPAPKPIVVEGIKATDKENLFRLDGVTFERNSSQLTAASYTQLDKVVKLMQENADVQLKVLGHTDNTASDEYNIWLSDKRAKSVAQYIESKGISPARLSAKGYGKSAPIDSNDTEAGRANNRRVEIEVIR